MNTFRFASIGLLLLGSTAFSATLTYTTILSGANENPAVITAGSGFGQVLLDTTTRMLQIDVTFQGLTGNTTASHIHCCATPPANAGVATQTPTFTGFPLGVTSGTYSRLFDLTLASTYNPAFVTAQGGLPQAEAALIAGLAAGRSYLNIHTSFAGGGEIRGTLTESIPEPATCFLAGTALLALALKRRHA